MQARVIPTHRPIGSGFGFPLGTTDPAGRVPGRVTAFPLPLLCGGGSGKVVGVPYVYPAVCVVLTPFTVTVTSTTPTACAGAVTVTVVAVTPVTVAGVVPNVTLVAPNTKPIPLIVTLPPPVGAPAAGLTRVTTGTYVRVPAAVCPVPGLVTMMGIAPTLWAGIVRARVVPSAFTVTGVETGAPEIVNCDPVWKPVPWKVTGPPPVGMVAWLNVVVTGWYSYAPTSQLPARGLPRSSVPSAWPHAPPPRLRANLGNRRRSAARLLPFGCNPAGSRPGSTPVLSCAAFRPVQEVSLARLESLGRYRCIAVQFPPEGFARSVPGVWDYAILV